MLLGFHLWTLSLLKKCFCPSPYPLDNSQRFPYSFGEKTWAMLGPAHSHSAPEYFHVHLFSVFECFGEHYSSEWRAHTETINKCQENVIRFRSHTNTLSTGENNVDLSVNYGLRQNHSPFRTFNTTTASSTFANEICIEMINDRNRR